MEAKSSGRGGVVVIMFDPVEIHNLRVGLLYLTTPVFCTPLRGSIPPASSVVPMLRKVNFKHIEIITSHAKPVAEAALG